MSKWKLPLRQLLAWTSLMSFCGALSGAISLVPITCLAQTPIGLYEGLMGNSGLALSDSMAPSFYNPSLLNTKNEPAYTLSANTFEKLNSYEAGTEFNASSMTPGYLSAILIGDALAHEFYLLNLAPSRVHLRNQNADSSYNNQTEGELDVTKYLLGYTMAFRSFPFALSYFGIFQDTSSYLSEEQFSKSSAVRILRSTRSQVISFDVGISVSGHAHFGPTDDQYTLGFQYRSRGLRLYDRQSGQRTTYTHGSPSASDFTKQELNFSPAPASSYGESLQIGHGFRGKHFEILTDTILEEAADLNHGYKVHQSFGLRAGNLDGNQILCGVKQQLGSEIRYFGQSTYYSVGYARKTRNLRSSIGFYYYQNLIEEEISRIGISFASEFPY